MDVLNVPGKQTIEQSVKDHHEHDKLQTVFIILHRGHCNVVPLHANPFYLIECKVLGAQTKCRR